MSGEFKAAFFNVGDGSCTVLKTPDHNVWVVDCGSRHRPFPESKVYTGTMMENDQITHAIINWIREDSEGYMDQTPTSVCLVITHHDADHYIYMSMIADALLDSPIKKLFVSDFDETDYQIAGKRVFEGIPTDYVIVRVHDDEENYRFNWEGEKRKRSRDVYFLGKYGKEPGSDTNDKSLIILFTWAGKSVLVTGDATNATINYNLSGNALLKPKDNIFNLNELMCDILSVPHHGADTKGTNSPLFIDSTQAKYVVISSHINSQDGHPKSRIFRRYLNLVKTLGEDHIICTNETLTLREFTESQAVAQFAVRDLDPELDLRFKNIYITKKNIYHTGSNGTIIFSWKNNNSQITVKTYDYDIEYIQTNIEQENFKFDPFIEIGTEKNMDEFLMGNKKEKKQGYIESLECSLQLLKLKNYEVLEKSVKENNSVLKNIEVLDLRALSKVDAKKAEDDHKKFVDRNTNTLIEKILEKCSKLIQLALPNGISSKDLRDSEKRFFSLK